MSQELLLKHRTAFLHALCGCGSAQHLERVLDILLAKGELGWEDYQSIQVPGRTLYSNARQLLDLVYTKGADSCGIFIAAVEQVLPEAQRAGLSLSGCPPSLEDQEKPQSASAETLVAQRPSLVCKLQGCIGGVLEALVDSGQFSSDECEEVQLPVYTPSQQVLPTPTSSANTIMINLIVCVNITHLLVAGVLCPCLCA